MDDTESRWSPERVLALAPDATSRSAGTALGVPGPWSGLGSAPADGAGGPWVWGTYQGGGAEPYRAVCELAEPPAFRCGCPSRKVPCKHVLGLLVLWAAPRAPAAVPDTAWQIAPDWVREWRVARRAAAGPGHGGQRATADPAAARRRAERREERVRAGAHDLLGRLADQVRSGFAAAGSEQWGAWEEVAARMVDAQAPGLAARVREFPAMAGSGGDWPSRMLEEFGLLHLLARGWLAHDGLPAGLAATVRTRVGFSTATSEVLSGSPVRDRWLVLAQQDGSEGRLTTRRIWLRGSRLGRPALLLSFGAAGRAPELELPVGRVLDAELAYHPAVLPLRATLAGRPVDTGAGDTPPGVPVGAALDGYGRAVCADPWLEEYPVVLAPVLPVPTAEGWQLADADGGAALPVAPRRLGRPGLWRLAAVSGGAPVTVFGSLGHRGFTPLTAWTGDPAEPEPAIPL